jgi:shikimate dehydrogenase
VRPDDLGDAVRGARAMNWKGFNCTIPHKVSVIPFLDRLNPAAEIIGAVNCVINREGELIGESTDGKGFLQSLATIRRPAGIRAVVLGAGGAARAIAVELALAAASSITVVNRDRDRGNALLGVLKDRTGVEASYVPWEGKYHIPEDADLVVNATSIGLFPAIGVQVPLNFDSLREGTIVSDVIPNPPRTHLLREAEGRGCRVLDGLGMLVNQGVIGIRLWTAHDPDPEVMRRALETIFA